MTRVAQGPIRQQRVGAAFSLPFLIALGFGDLTGYGSLVASGAVGIVAVYRALRMGLERRGDVLIITNLLSSTAVEVRAVESAHFERARGPVYRLCLKQNAGSLVRVDGVSITRRAFPELGTDPTRNEIRAREAVAGLLEGTGVTLGPGEGA